MDPPLVFSSRPGVLRIRLHARAIGYSPAARSQSLGARIASLWRTAIGATVANDAVRPPPPESESAGCGTDLPADCGRSPCRAPSGSIRAREHGTPDRRERPRRRPIGGRRGRTPDAVRLPRRSCPSRAEAHGPRRLPRRRRNAHAGARRAASPDLPARQPLQAMARRSPPCCSPSEADRGDARPSPARPPSASTPSSSTCRSRPSAAASARREARWTCQRSGTSPCPPRRRSRRGTRRPPSPSRKPLRPPGRSSACRSVGSPRSWPTRASTRASTTQATCSPARSSEWRSVRAPPARHGRCCGRARPGRPAARCEHGEAPRPAGTRGFPLASRKPDPVVGGHPSGTHVAVRLMRPKPGSLGRATLKRSPIWSCTGRGLPSRPVTRTAGELLPHRFTLTRTPRKGPLAVCSLLRFPSGFPGWPLASALLCGVRTFLDREPPELRGASRRDPTAATWLAP